MVVTMTTELQEARRIRQIGGLDAAFLYCETPTMHMHVCALLVLDPSASPDGDIFDRIRSRLIANTPEIPLMRQKLATVPLNLGRPFWVDDPGFDVDRHLHRVDLGSPGGECSLTELAGTIASRPLDRDRPLWEMWVVEGLPDDRVAVIAKMHHATIDGVSGANLMGLLFDFEPRVHPSPGPLQRFRPGSQPGRLELLGRGLQGHLGAPWQVARLLPATALRAGTTLWRLGQQRGRRPGATKPFTAPRVSFNATVTARRSVAFTDVSLADIKKVKEICGVKVNDVITTVVGGALRHYLEDHETVPDRALIAAVPVSVHHDTASSKGVTRLSVMFSTLATDIEDPLERLRVVAEANTRAKEIHQMVGADTLVQWAQHFWLNGFSLGARLYSDLHLADHHPVVHNLVLSNVLGPPVPLYLAGARLVGIYPLGPIMDGAGLNVTVISQEDRVGFGIVSCPDLVPDVWDVANAVPEALDHLVQRAGGD